MTKNKTESTIKAQKIHEAQLNRSYKKDFGVFLTNNIETIDKILDVVDFSPTNILNKRVLEPACGNGVFVIRFLERLFQSVKNEKALFSFIQNNLFFIDIDEKMISITKDHIKKFYSFHFGKEYNGKFNSYVLDFTKRVVPRGDSLFDTQLDSPLTKILNKIDYVIGNPPYVSLYGRRDRKKSEEQRVYYLNRYSQFPASLKNGKINYVMLFIEHSIDFLTEGGKLSFIIDLAFFETAYKHTRKYLLENTAIISIIYNIEDFDVASGQIILTLQKKQVSENIVTIIDSDSKTEIQVNQKVWNNPRDQYRFRFDICSKSAEIIDKIQAKKFPTLKSLYPKKNLRTCTMLLNMGDKFVSETKREKENVKIYPYYQGSKSLKAKYAPMEYSQYFHYDKALQDEINERLKIKLASKGIKNKKRIGLGETIIYDNSKVYIRQSAKEIIASFDKKPSSANNSLYVFSLRNSSEQSNQFLRFLCGLLNSELITFYAQQREIIRYSKGKQPQIKVSDLYTIPVPDDAAIQKEIANLVEQIYGHCPVKCVSS